MHSPKQDAQQEENEEEIIGDKQSKTYFPNGCQPAKPIAENNKVIFKTTADAGESRLQTSETLSIAKAQENTTMLKEFKEFIARGNVIDLAVAVVIGAAFGKIVTSLVEGVIMPPIGLLLGKADFSNLFIDISGQNPAVAGGCTVERFAGHRLRKVFQRHRQLPDHRVRYFPDRQSRQSAESAHRRHRQTPRIVLVCLTAIPLAATRCSACCVDLVAAEA